MNRPDVPIFRRPATGSGSGRGVPPPSPGASPIWAALGRLDLSAILPRPRHDPRPVRLTIGVIAVIGAVAIVWLFGLLGFAFGFASILHVPSLHINASGALIAGAAMFTTVPGSLVHTALTEPLWLILGAVLIAIPAAGLAAIGSVKPAEREQSSHTVLDVVFSNTGAIVGMVNAVIVLVWVGSPMRLRLVTPLPFEVGAIRTWFDDLRLAAGIDAMILLSVGLWIVLILRLAIPRWVRGMAGTAAFAAFVIAVFAAAATNVAVSQMNLPRTLVAQEDGQRLLVGRDDVGRVLMLSTAAAVPRSSEPGIVDPGPIATILLEFADPFDLPGTVAGRQSIIRFLRQPPSGL